MDLACIADDHKRNSFREYAEGKKTIQIIFSANYYVAD